MNSLIQFFVIFFCFVVYIFGREPPPPPSLRSVACSACIVVLQEIEGLPAESKNEQEITQIIETRCKSFSPIIKFVCDTLAKNIPSIIKFIDTELSPPKTCISLDICDKYTPTGKDDVPLAKYQINLDEKPENRWTEIVNKTQYWSNLYKVYDTMKAVLSDDITKGLLDIGSTLFKEFKEPFSGEIKGISEVTGLPIGFISILNLFYEFTNACTSIVAKNSKNEVIFARNQDLGYGMGFTDLLRNDTIYVQFMKNNEIVGEGVTFVGYVGLPTAYVPGKWALAVNQRFYNGSFEQYLDTIYTEIKIQHQTYFSFTDHCPDFITKKQKNEKEHNAHLPTWLARENIQNMVSYSEAKQSLSNDPLVTSCYYILGGEENGTGFGSVIARNQEGTRYTQEIDKEKGTWYLLQTNYDFNRAPPWEDDRRYYGNKAMHKYCGENGSNVTENCLFQTLSTRPVLNLLTLYTAQANIPKKTSINGHYRVCHEKNGIPCSL